MQRCARKRKLLSWSLLALSRHFTGLYLNVCVWSRWDTSVAVAAVPVLKQQEFLNELRCVAMVQSNFFYHVYMIKFSAFSLILLLQFITHCPHTFYHGVENFPGMNPVKICGCFCTTKKTCTGGAGPSFGHFRGSLVITSSSVFG